MQPSGVLRRIDHIVMPVTSLSASRTFFKSLGFTVAPAAAHPFGTENACVFFADGTYLEPLAIGDAASYAAAGQSGAVFVSRDAAFRFRRGVPGFSGIAFQSDDAEADWRAFRDAGLADGDFFQFARTFEAPDGTRRELGFRLAFAAERRSPDLFFFACQALAKPGDRSALTRHANGVSGIAHLVLSEPQPQDFQPLLQDLLGREDAETGPEGLRLAAADAVIEVLTPAGLAGRYGAERNAERGLRFEGVVVRVPDLGPVEERASRGGLNARREGDCLVVPLAEAGGPFLAFEATA
jgi:catechol 2,3-dioxygenase-like lactoylglutathione lyase family enzyme